MSAVPRADWKEFLFWLLRKRKRYRIQGSSLYPKLNAGTKIFVSTSFKKPLERGDVVLFLHPFEAARVLVKEVAFITPHGRIHVRSTDSFGIDSRLLGNIASGDILGMVTSKC